MLLAWVTVLSLLEGLDPCLPISVVQLVLRASDRSPTLGQRFDDQLTNTTESLNCLSVRLSVLMALASFCHLPLLPENKATTSVSKTSFYYRTNFKRILKRFILKENLNNCFNEGIFSQRQQRRNYRENQTLQQKKNENDFCS